MTQKNLQDALNLIDDDMIAAMDQLRQKHRVAQAPLTPSDESPATPMSSDPSESEASFSSFRRRILRREFLKWGSVAACLCLFIGVTWIWSRTGTSMDSAESGNDFQYSEDQNMQMEVVLENEELKDQTFDEPETASPTKPETDKTDSAAETVIPSPPDLILVSGNQEITATSGNYSWSSDNGDGTESTVIACGFHPLDSQDFIARLQTSQPTAQLQFACTPYAPTDISVECWSEEHWGDIAAESELVAVTDGQIQLLPGGHIYQVKVTWARGTAEYAFYVYYKEGTP